MKKQKHGETISLCNSVSKPRLEELSKQVVGCCEKGIFPDKIYLSSYGTKSKCRVSGFDQPYVKISVLKDKIDRWRAALRDFEELLREDDE